MTEGDLLGAIRQHGLRGLEDVGLAVLETNGSISIIPRDPSLAPAAAAPPPGTRLTSALAAAGLAGGIGQLGLHLVAQLDRAVVGREHGLREHRAQAARFQLVDRGRARAGR